MFRSPSRMHRNVRSAIALAVLSLLAAQAHAAPRTVYTGTLQGAGDIVLELDTEAAADGTLTGRYFYAKHGVDIPLRGTAKELFEPKPRQEGKPADQAASWQEPAMPPATAASGLTPAAASSYAST